LPQLARRHPGTLPGLRCLKGLPIRIFVEVFSGCGRLSAAMAARGYHVLEWDIRHGAAYDLAQPSIQRRLRGWVLSGRVAALHLGTPCSSWSRARDRPGGPPRLRSDEYVLGLPGLREADQIKVSMGNRLAKYSASLLFACRHMRVPATLENPALSRLWMHPGIHRVSHVARASDVVCDLCQFGARWLKPTRVLGIFVELSPLARRCNFRQQHFVCSVSGRRHMSLTGTTSQGKHWTSIAEHYPARFCQVLASILDNGVCCARGEVLSQYISRPSARPFGHFGHESCP
jgi:hypothetical protein